MTQLVAVTPERYSGKFWLRYSSYAFAAHSNLAPLVGAELARAAQSMPIAFIEQGNRYILVGVLSLLPGQNLFVGPQGQWLGDYVPSCFRSYPFLLAGAEGREDRILCVDEASGLISDTGGESFFDEQGKVSQSLRDVMSFLSQVEQNRAVTEQAVSALAAAGLVVHWPLKVKVGEEEKPIAGLYRVDELGLGNLDDEAFLKLRKANALPVLYAQLLSMANINVFEKLGKVKSQMDDPGVPDLAGLFGEEKPLSFNF